MASPSKNQSKSREPVPNNAVGLMVQLLFVALAAFGVYGFVVMAKEGELRRRCTPLCALKPQYAGAERVVPSFTLLDMNGKPVSIESYRGKVVVLNFWTKTCGPCLEEMPALVELTHLLASRDDVAVLTVSTDDGPDDVRDLLKSLLKDEPPFPVLFDPNLQVVRDKFGTTLFPETWVLDKRGVVRARFDGQRDWTSSIVTELVDQLRGGGYCPLRVQGGVKSGEGAAICSGT